MIPMDNAEQTKNTPSQPVMNFPYTRETFYGLNPDKVYILALHISKEERKNRQDVTQIVNQTSLYLKVAGLKNVVVVPYNVSIFEQNQTRTQVNNQSNLIK